MDKTNKINFLSKMISLTTAFVLIGNICISSANEVVKTITSDESISVSEESIKDIDTVELANQKKEDIFKKQNQDSKTIEEGISLQNQEKNSVSTYSIGDTNVEFISTENSNIQIDVNKVNIQETDGNSYYIETLGFVTNRGKVTYSFDIEAKFYDESGYQFNTETDEIYNVRPGEEETFKIKTYLWGRNVKKVELYINDVKEIYTDTTEDKIDVKITKLEQSTDSNGSNRETIATVKITNNNDYLYTKLGFKVSLLNSSGKVVNILDSMSGSYYNNYIEDLGAGETREVKIEAPGIHFETPSEAKTKVNITTTEQTSYKIESVEFNKQSPQMANQKIDMTAIVSGGGYYNTEYKYSYYDGINWNVIKNWSTDKTATWTPTKEGNYQVKVEIRSSNSDKIKARKIFNYNIINPNISNLVVNIDKKSPQIAGTPITIKASATGVNKQYRYEIKKGSKLVAKKDFSSATSYRWIPNEEGEYKINVYARNSKYSNFSISKSVYYKVNKPSVSINSITIDKKSPQPTDSKLKIKANANGSNLLYKFSYSDGKTWRTIKDYSTSSSVVWTPKVAGNLTIKVDVKVNNTKYRVTKTIKYNIFKKGTVSISSFTADKKSPQPQSSSIRLTAKAVGSNLEYRFSVSNGKKWTVLKNYSTSNTYLWKPKKLNGSYKLKVDVRTKGTSKVQTKVLEYNIFKPGGVKINSLKINTTNNILEDSYITVTANATGKYLEYRFKSCDPVYSNWYTEQEFSSSKSAYIYLPNPGTNKIKVEVRQKGTSKIYSKIINLKVYEIPSVSHSGYYWYENISGYKYLDYGYFTIQNYSKNPIAIKKIEMVTNGNTVYRYTPTAFTIKGNDYGKIYYYDSYNETNYGSYMNSSTYWKVTYQCDGLTYSFYSYPK